jgi:hypothetical protein
MSIVFFIGVYDDQERAKKRIAELKVQYPMQKVLSISDGKHDASYRDFCSNNGVTYFEGKHLKGKHTGQWTQRRLKFFLDNSDAEYVVKIDPDTRVQKTMWFPEVDVSAPVHLATLPTIGFSGCCLCISRTLAQRLVSSDVLMQQKYQTQDYPLEDMILTEIFSQWKVEVHDLPDVISNMKTGQDVSKYAFAHPVRD